MIADRSDQSDDIDGDTAPRAAMPAYEPQRHVRLAPASGRARMRIEVDTLLSCSNSCALPAHTLDNRLRLGDVTTAIVKARVAG